MKKKTGEVAKHSRNGNGVSRTQEKLLDAAVELFSANGFNGTSVRDIAKHAGMTISNIYYYYGSKEGLLVAILERATREIVDRLRQAVICDLKPLERFKLLLKTHFDHLINVARKEADVLFLEEENVSRFVKPFQIELMNIYRTELEGLQSLGYIKQKNITILAFSIFGVINWHLRWYKPGGKMSLEQVAEEMVDFILHGMSGDPCESESTTEK